MKSIATVFLVLFISAAVPAQTTGTIAEKTKNWYIGIGPVFTTAMPGATGTKSNLDVAYTTGLSEKINLKLYYDVNLNSASTGSTGVNSVGAATAFFTGDRGADTSPFLETSVGYGGGNRYEDASATGGLGLGCQLFRTKEYIFEAILRRQVTATRAVSAFGSYPSIDQLRLGVYF